MADIERLSEDLLQWMYNNGDDPRVGEFFAEHEVSRDDGYDLVDFLADLGLVKSYSTFGGADARLTAQGKLKVQQIRKHRDDPAHRARELQARMLRWLSSEQRRLETSPSSWDAFLDSETALYQGAAFSEDEVSDQAEYLGEQGFVKALSSFSIPNRHWLRPSLTAEGRHCLIQYDGDVRAYFNSSAPGGNTVVHVGENRGNLAVNSQGFTQNVVNEFDVAKVVEFARYVREVAPILAVSPEVAGDLARQAAVLEEASSGEKPDRGTLRGRVEKLLRGLEEATPGAALNVAIDLGKAAVQLLL